MILPEERQCGHLFHTRLKTKLRRRRSAKNRSRRVQLLFCTEGDSRDIYVVKRGIFDAVYEEVR